MNTTVIQFHLLEPITHIAALWGSDTHSRVWKGVNSNAGKPDMFKEVWNPSVAWRRELQ